MATGTLEGLVILPGNPPDGQVLDETWKLLSPYGPYLKTEPYKTRCHCVGFDAMMESSDQADSQMGSCDLSNRDMQKAHVRLRRSLIEAHPKKDLPMADCRDCQGIGLMPTTWNDNPAARFDSWMIDAHVCGVERGDQEAVASTMAPTELGARPLSTWIEDRSKWLTKEVRGGVATDQEQMVQSQTDANALKVSHLPSFYFPYAIVTPDGVWHESPEVGEWRLPDSAASCLTPENMPNDTEWLHWVIETLTRFASRMCIRFRFSLPSPE